MGVIPVSDGVAQVAKWGPVNRIGAEAEMGQGVESLVEKGIKRLMGGEGEEESHVEKRLKQ